MISGLGDLHMRYIMDRMQAQYHVEVTKPPRIPYRETITAKAEGHHRHKKQSNMPTKKTKKATTANCSTTYEVTAIKTTRFTAHCPIR